MAGAGAGVLKFLPSGLRLQPSDVTAAVGWGIAAGAGALYIVQPFDWLKKQLFEKPEPEQ